jgi:hypothetical protein
MSGSWALAAKSTWLSTSRSRTGSVTVHRGQRAWQLRSHKFPKRNLKLRLHRRLLHRARPNRHHYPSRPRRQRLRLRPAFRWRRRLTRPVGVSQPMLLRPILWSHQPRQFPLPRMLHASPHPSLRLRRQLQLQRSPLRAQRQSPTPRPCQPVCRCRSPHQQSLPKSSLHPSHRIHRRQPLRKRRS